MSNVAVSIRNVGKKYQIGELAAHGKTFRESIMDLAKAPFRSWRELGGAEDENRTFWALRDVSLDVRRGSAIAIIGHNGAGKSTLLKILSRITEPSTGRVEVEGRLGSLLEVGTGFHPELTGRENIYVNASILGMSRAEVKCRFDEIVEFSGVEQFIDTPVKRYSSGMNVRLAFSVAAHLEPEILVVDEVLSVGDAEFQSRCLGKMKDVAGHGRTVLLVSHDMAAVESLCQTACLLDSGQMVGVGKVNEIVRRYLETSTELTGEVDLERHPGRPPGMRPILRRMRMVDENEMPTPAVRIGGTIRFQFDLHSETLKSARLMVLRVLDSRGMTMLATTTGDYQNEYLNIEGHSRITCSLKNIRLAAGRYHLQLALKSGATVHDEIRSHLEFEVLRIAVDPKLQPKSRRGVIIPEADWDYRDHEAETYVPSAP